jgi:hypothetical protein
MDREPNHPPGAAAEPNERAFSGHPDHPPMQPDQTPENNRVLLGEDGEDDATDAPDRQQGR